MTLDASIRRAVLVAEARGFVVEDSQPVLNPVPQIIIEPGDEDIFLEFADGLGWGTTRNSYKGYGWNFMWTHNSAPPSTITSALDAGDNDDIPVYNSGTGQYEPKNFDDAGIARTIGYEPITIEVKKPTNRDYHFMFEAPYDLIIEDTYSAFIVGPGSVSMPSGTYSKGDPVFATVSGTSAASEYLRMQIVYSYNRNQVF